MNDDLKFYIPFTKKNIDERKVGGYASTESLDSQGEVVERTAIEKALPTYLGEFDQQSGRFRFGNLREMHQLSAVGKTMKAMVDNKGLFIEGKVVDDNAWKKVKEGVYTGFSIGGKILNKVGNRIKELRLSEISLVDRPANPEALFSLVKIADGTSNEVSHQGGDSMDKVQKALNAEEAAEAEVQYMFEEVNDASLLLSVLGQLIMLYKFHEENEGHGDKLLNIIQSLKDFAVEELSETEEQEDGAEVEEGEIDIDLAKKLNIYDTYKMIKAKLPFRERKNMPKAEFAYTDQNGGKHLPIHDAAHARNAMARFNQTKFESPDKKKAAAKKILAAAKKFGVEIDDTSAIAQAAKKSDLAAGLEKLASHLNEIAKGASQDVTYQDGELDEQGNMKKDKEVKCAKCGKMVMKKDLEQHMLDSHKEGKAEESTDISKYIQTNWSPGYFETMKKVNG